MATGGSQMRYRQDEHLDYDNFQNLCIVAIVVLLIVVIFVHYAWGVARYHSTSAWNAINVTSFSRNLQSSQPQGLHAAMINRLPITIYHRPPTTSNLSETNEPSECSICLGVFEEGEKVKVLQSCRHCYHCECVDKWLVTHSTCPMCRTSVRVVDSSV